MAPKRKVEINIDENQRALYSTFRNTANHLSQFCALSITHQKLAFEAGQNYALLKFHEWMIEKLQEGRIVTVPEIVGYLQAKLDDWVPDAGPSEQGASGSGQNSASAEMAAASSSAPHNQDSDGEMQTD